jgi:hypothetical protein
VGATGRRKTGLLVASAVASICRTAFRISETAERHGRLAYAWNELSLDMDRAIANARREGSISPALHDRMEDLFRRFQRTEMISDVEAIKRSSALSRARLKRRFRRRACGFRLSETPTS